MTSLPLTADSPAVADACAACSRSPRVAVDTEFLRERTYVAELALVQLATHDAVWLVDPLAGAELAPLAALLLDTRVVKVVHAARQDLEVLLPLTGAPAAPVLDTQIAAAMIGLAPQIGYADLVQRLLGVALAKGGAGGNLARTDWTRRPLSDAQRDYAADDVRHLLAVAERLEEELEARGRLAWWLADCAALADPGLYRLDPDDAWQRLKGIENAVPREQARLRALAHWREVQARTHNLPRSWILADDALRDLAARPPADLAALKRREAFRAETAERIGAELLGVLAQAEDAPLDGLTQRPSIRPTAAEQALTKRLSACLAQLATDLGVAPELLATQRDLRRLARGDRTPEGVLAGWRLPVAGTALAAVADAG